MCIRACVYACVYTCITYILLCTSLVFVYSSRRHGHQDPHKELLDRNVLMVRGSLVKTAEHFKMAEEEVGRLLTGARETLFREWLPETAPPPVYSAEDADSDDIVKVFHASSYHCASLL